MTSNEYQQLTGRTESLIDPDNPKPPYIRHPHSSYVGVPISLLRILHHVLGLVTEAGEAADQLKRHMFYYKPLDMLNLVEEAGDTQWYVARLLDSIGWAMQDSQVRNIEKLKARYPDKFDAVQAVNRDLEKERAALEGQPAVKPQSTPTPIQIPPLKFAPGGVGEAVMDVMQKTMHPQTAESLQQELQGLASFFLQAAATVTKARIDRGEVSNPAVRGCRIRPPKVEEPDAFDQHHSPSMKDREKCGLCPGLAGPNGLCEDCQAEYDAKSKRQQSPGQQRATSLDQPIRS